MYSDMIRIGLKAKLSKEAGMSDILPSYDRSGILYSLAATPTILMMAIEASSKLLDPLLPEEDITVGQHIDLYHEKPTLVGETLTLTLTVTNVAGRKVTMDLMVEDAAGTIAKGVYERFIVNKEKLINEAYARTQNKIPIR